jgi:hypothetical protein
MMKLLEKNKAFEWTKECQASFEELRKCLTSAPVLVLPDLTKKFDIYCDTSRQGLGCVLMQEGQVVCYASDHRVPNLCLTIPGLLHQVSYSCLDPHRCPPCLTCHLHNKRQANSILHTNKGNSVEPQKCPGFEFKPRHVND